MFWSKSRRVAGGQVWVQGVRALGHGAVLVGTCEQIWKYDNRRNFKWLPTPTRPSPSFMATHCPFVGNRPKPTAGEESSQTSCLSGNSCPSDCSSIFINSSTHSLAQPTSSPSQMPSTPIPVRSHPPPAPQLDPRGCTLQEKVPGLTQDTVQGTLYRSPGPAKFASHQADYLT